MSKPTPFVRHASVALAIVGSIVLVSCSAADAADRERSERLRRSPRSDNVGDAKRASARKPEPIVDKSIDAYRLRLLDTAFRAASKYPDLHLKSRGRSQERVVNAALKLGQPRRALRYSEQVANWRRGACYAAFALYCAQRANPDEIGDYLEKANRIARRVGSEQNQQMWRRDRVRAQIAKAYATLGDAARAKQFSVGVVDSEAGRAAHAAPSLDDAAAFTAHLKHVDDVLAACGFDIARNMLAGCVELHERFYADADRRAALETRIKRSFDKLPVQVRYELLADTIESTLTHGDKPHALELVNHTSDVVSSARWAPEDEIAFRARIAGLRFRAGDTIAARDELKTLEALYGKTGDKIQNFWRGKALRPLAEAFAVIEPDDAARLYALTFNEGAVNPNARPRANDFIATCISMAIAEVEPDKALWARIDSIDADLKDPW